MPPARYANAPIIQISTAYHHIGGRANWQLQTLEIYRRTDAQLQLVATLLAGDKLTSPLLPGFSVEIERIFS